MTFDAHILKVLIASPGDTGDERNAVSDAIQDFNVARGEREQIVLLPWRWEKHAVPVLGNSAQGVINSQAVDSTDLVIAIFDSRLGQATENAVSGTAEEITRAHQAGKPVHVWFSSEDLPRDVDPDQLHRLNSFKDDLSKLGLLGQYSSPSDLAYKVRDALEADVTAMGLGSVNPIKKKGEHAIPVARYKAWKEQTGTDSKGKPRIATRERIVLENKSSSVVAEGLTIDFGAIAKDVFVEDDAPFDLHPLSDVQWTVGLDMGSPASVDVVIRWTDNGEPQEKTQRVSLNS